MKKKPQKSPVHLPRAQWADAPDSWRGRAWGEILNSDVTVLFFGTDEVGSGPKWHVHPYDELFIIRKGRARFTIGDTVIDADEGDVLMGPAAVPHKFHNLGPGPLETIDIHLSREWIQTDLVDPELK